MNGIVVPAVVVAGTGAVVAAFLVPVLAHFAPRFRLLDRPGTRKRHQQPVPLVGGIAIVCAGFVAVGVATFVWPARAGFPWWPVYGVVLILVAGVVDDLFEMPNWLKAILQLAAILPLVMLSGLKVTSLGALFASGTIQLGYAAVPFTVICILGYINALNMADGLDGLAGGIAAISLVLLAACAALQNDSKLFLIVLGFGAALVVFLGYNLRVPGRVRARVFLGDAGSMVLGLIIALAAVHVAGRPAQPGSAAVHVPPMAVAWVLALPVMDTLVVAARRLWLGRNPFSADRLHLHYLLIDVGLTPGQATWALIGLSLVYGLYGLMGAWAGLSEWLLGATFLAVLVVHGLSSSMAHRRASLLATGIANSRSIGQSRQG